MDEEKFLKIDYGNLREELSIKRSGDYPATFIPTGIYSVSTYRKKFYIPDGLKFSIKVFDYFSHLERTINLNVKDLDNQPILFGDILVDSNEIYLTDTLKNILYIVNFKGMLLKKIFFKKITSRISSPSLIFKDNKKRLYISDRNNSRLIIFQDNSFKNYKILYRIENPFVLKNGIIVTTHLQNENREVTISLIDSTGKFIGELYNLKESSPMTQVKCIGINRQNSFFFYYKTRGEFHLFVISASGRFIEKFSFPSEINIILLNKYCIMDNMETIFKLSSAKKRLIITKLVND